MDLKKEYERICDDLEKTDNEKHTKETIRINAYRDGYYQACEDFYKMLLGIKEEQDHEHAT